MTQCNAVVLSDELGFTGRRTYRIVRLSLSLQRHRPLPKDDKTAIKRMKALAPKNRRCGYLRLLAMLRQEGLVVNNRCTARLFTEHALQGSDQ